MADGLPLAVAARGLAVDRSSNRRASKGRGWVPDHASIGSHTYCYRRGPGRLTPDFLTLSHTLGDLKR